MAWWQQSTSRPSDKVVDMDEEEAVIDLTSDTEASSPAPAAAATPMEGIEVISPWMLQQIAVSPAKNSEKDKKKEVKSEGIKRAAEASKEAAQSGEVLVTSKPAEDIDTEAARPAKRSKGPGDDDDLAVVGTTGTKKLPHNRFACTEHTFGGYHGSNSHKEKCSLCYCYVCDRLASDCLEWSDHCHATDTGPMKHSWKILRERAKGLLQAGKRPPVSGRYGPSSAAGSGSGSSSSASGPSPSSSSSSGSGSGSGFGLAAPNVGLSSSSSSNNSSTNPSSNVDLPNACNCEEFCLPVHHVFFSDRPYESPKAKAAMVYLNGLTAQQAQHVEDISVRSTVEVAAQKRYNRRYNPGAKMLQSSKAAIMTRLKKELAPAVRVVPQAGKLNVTVAAQDPDGRIRAPFAVKWTPGSYSLLNPAVRLGGVSEIPFCITLPPGASASATSRQAYFERFVSTKPMAPTLWYAMNRLINDYNDRFDEGSVIILKDEDKLLMALLRSVYEQDLVDVEVTAKYDANTNSGSYKLEVVLLGKLLRRGMSMTPRSCSDLVPLVERVVLKRTYKTPSSSTAASQKKQARLAALSPKPSSAMVNGGVFGHPVVPGKEFTPSAKGYGGCSSLDVTLSGLIDSVRLEESNVNVQTRRIYHPAKMLVELENLQHRALPKQPDCLTVQLYEHQKQDAQWMMDQEMLKGGSMQHLWAELPPHPQANAQRTNEFRRCWFSPILNQFTIVDPFTSSIKGGILCDEMGLGKTAATLVLHLIHPAKTPSPGVPLDEKEWGRIAGHQATTLKDNKSLGAAEAPAKWVSKGTLVVCKVSLVGQWVEEAKRLCGGALTIYPYHGQGRKKDPAFLAKFDIVVTTYGVVQADQSRNGGFPPLRRIRWWRVVLDESHTIAQKSADVMGIVANRRWCMTGTPYISRFSDVTLQLGFMGAEGAFKRGDLGDKGANSDTQAETVAFLRRVLLRHSQGMQLGGKSILGLPTMTHKVEVLKMPTKEREAYREFEKALQKDYVKIRYRLRNLTGSHTMDVLTLLSRFRQACSGGQLLVGDTAANAGSGASSAASFDAFCPVCSDILESPVTTHCGHTFCQACISSMLTKTDNDEGPCPKCKKTVLLGDLRSVGGGAAFGAKSEPQQHGGSSAGAASSTSTASTPGVVMETKLKALVQKLADIHAKDPTSKSLVFSQFNSSLDWLKRTLPKKGFQFRTLTGNMSRKQRTDALSAFARDPPTTVFLLSVRSGAVGINLTQANNVFLLEPLLNLALEKQAVGRVYRLGQERPVTVTKLVLEDSIETRILALQKKQAAEGTASAAATSGPSSQGVAGNIARDNAKNLRIEEYNALFGVTEAAEKVAPPVSSFHLTMERKLQERIRNNEKARKRKAKKEKAKKSGWGSANGGGFPTFHSYNDDLDSDDY